MIDELVFIADVLKDATTEVDLEVNYSKMKMMTNLVPSGPIQIEKALYIYMCHEIKISKDNHTSELEYAAFGKLKSIFSADILVKLKRQCVLPSLIYGAEILASSAGLMHFFHICFVFRRSSIINPRN